VDNHLLFRLRRSTFALYPQARKGMIGETLKFRRFSREKPSFLYLSRLKLGFRPQAVDIFVDYFILVY